MIEEKIMIKIKKLAIVFSSTPIQQECENR
jgi:hypothetical protein